MNRVKLIIGLAIPTMLFLGGCSSGTVVPTTKAPTTGSYTFRLNVSKGEKYTYQLGMTTADPKEASEMKVAMVVDDVKPDQVTLRSNVVSMKRGGKELGEQYLDMVRKVSILQVMDKKGNPISSRVEEAGAAQRNIQTNNTAGVAAFPDRAVRVGDTWTAKSNTAQGVVEADYKFVRIESTGGKELAVLETKPKTGGEAFDGPMVFKVDTKTGMPEEMTVKMSNPQMGKATLTMKRVSA